nr:MotA/TolQ/ExbB proton channel family protein [bacterium]
MIENIVNGGYTMIALAACSLLSVAVIIERGIRLRRRRILPIPMLAAVRSFRPGDPDPGEAGEAPLGKVLSAIYRNRNLSWELDNEAAQVGLKQAEATMEQGLVILEIVAVISPLLGLLGTVLGMVKVFGVISQVGIGQAQAMAGG